MVAERDDLCRHLEISFDGSLVAFLKLVLLEISPEGDLKFGIMGLWDYGIMGP